MLVSCPALVKFGVTVLFLSFWEWSLEDTLFVFLDRSDNELTSRVTGQKVVSLIEVNMRLIECNPILSQLSNQVEVMVDDFALSRQPFHLCKQLETNLL